MMGGSRKRCLGIKDCMPETDHGATDYLSKGETYDRCAESCSRSRPTARTPYVGSLAGHRFVADFWNYHDPWSLPQPWPAVAYACSPFCVLLAMRPIDVLLARFGISLPQAISFSSSRCSD